MVTVDQDSKQADKVDKANHREGQSKSKDETKEDPDKVMKKILEDHERAFKKIGVGLSGKNMILHDQYLIFDTSTYRRRDCVHIYSMKYEQAIRT